MHGAGFGAGIGFHVPNCMHCAGFGAGTAQLHSWCGDGCLVICMVAGFGVGTGA